MEYRRLGNSGLKVSVLSFGSWVTFGPQLDTGLAADCMAAAWDAGCNFFDNAEAYAGGESERLMGEAFRKNDWKRHEYVVSSKFYWGIHESPNTKYTLNRKYLLDAIPASLERMGLDYLDLIYCHRADPDTPIEETVWAMSDAIDRGWALYWGTSEWNADEIRAAYEIAERHHLHKPVMEQPQYNMLTRRKVEKEYSRLYEDLGLGLTTWSPLASGLLSGKYIDGIPEDSRAALDGYEWIKDMVSDEAANEKVRKLRDIAEELDATPAQLAIAWCARNPNVSSVITGASKVEQVVENMRAVEVLAKLTDKTMERVDAIL
ncbi:potassium channel beta subunit family protein [Actinospongicola halichondriae]|uniref:potassium channel beta subunit family protein n=1 Tax=Actinospongicola halichondriae TaxID=3236844 RepID=UPI003D552D6C